MDRVLVIGATGFVGKNIYEILVLSNYYVVRGTSRKPSEDLLYLDLENQNSWDNCVKFKPTVIIDATGYGVVKHQKDIEKLYNINYREKKKFVRHIYSFLPDVFWMQIGTAFEYDLSVGAITEDTPCLPNTHYGISKFMFSNFLQSSNTYEYLIIRPFGMFGKYEDNSKIFPYLINAQKNKERVNLSSGMQERDYFFVEDLARFMFIGIEKRKELKNRVINLGSNTAISLRKLATTLGNTIDDYDPSLWNWGKINQRTNEGTSFFNISTFAMEVGFIRTPTEEAFTKTTNHYYNLK